MIGSHERANSVQPRQDRYDVVIVGGGAAGLSAALLLGRARRSVCVVDAGRPRNLPAKESHSFFTRDGTPPGELVRVGREQLAAYPTVEIVSSEVVGASGKEGRFEVSFSSGRAIVADKVILAIGVRDELPDIPGARELWGGSVFHCPYCHGYEVRDLPLAIVLGRDDDPIALAQLLKGWSEDLVLFPHERELARGIRDELASHGVVVHDGRIASFEAEGGHLSAVVLADGARVARAGAFLRPPQAIPNAIATQLGCRTTSDGLLEIGAEFETSVPGVYAVGDCVRRLQQVVIAAADGATAAIHANKKLLAQAWARGGRPPS